MALLLVVLVQRVVVRVEGHWQHAHLQVLVLVPDALLAAVGLKGLCQHSDRHTCAAAVTVGAVCKQAAAPKALCDQAGVNVVVYQVTWCGHL